MTQKELIKEAESRYPIGTKFKPAHITGDDVIYEVEGGWQECSSLGIKCVVKNGHTWTPTLYWEHKWAEIVGQPKSEIINNYNLF